jgi:hypothetical protein
MTRVLPPWTREQARLYLSRAVATERCNRERGQIEGTNLMALGLFREQPLFDAGTLNQRVTGSSPVRLTTLFSTIASETPLHAMGRVFSF